MSSIEAKRLIEVLKSQREILDLLRQSSNSEGEEEEEGERLEQREVNTQAL